MIYLNAGRPDSTALCCKEWPRSGSRSTAGEGCSGLGENEKRSWSAAHVSPRRPCRLFSATFISQGSHWRCHRGQFSISSAFILSKLKSNDITISWTLVPIALHSSCDGGGLWCQRATPLGTKCHLLPVSCRDNQFQAYHSNNIFPSMAQMNGIFDCALNYFPSYICCSVQCWTAAKAVQEH